MSDKKEEAQVELEKEQEAANATNEEVQATDACQGENTESLNSEIEELKGLLDKSKDDLLRAQAELQNMRRRCETEVAKAKNFAIERFVQSLLPAIDPLEKSVQYMDRTNEQLKPILDGVEQTLSLLIQALTNNGISAIDPKVGEDVLDPNIHHAIQMVENEETPTNTILTVVQKGYQLNGRVIRPALVVVSKGGVGQVDAQA